MSRSLPNKYFSVLIVLLLIITGCTTHQKTKRGIVFRGDWAFEINRTPWVGHPGTTDIPNTGRKDADNEQEGACEKDSESMFDSLLGPLAGNFKKKCICKRCQPQQFPSNGNINITSYNPTVANSFPGNYTTPILPPGAIALPNGVLMPNGSLLPYSIFTQQIPVTQSSIPATINNLGPTESHSLSGQSDTNTQIPSLQTSPQQIGGTPSNIIPPQPQSGQLSQPATNQAAPITTPVPNNQSSLQYQNPLSVTQTAPFPPVLSGATTTAETTYAPTPQVSVQNSLLQALNDTNPMLINPANAQVLPGMSMTGTQSPGYPPIAYAQSGYSPGYAQQLPPALTGPLTGNVTSNMAYTASQTKETEQLASITEDEKNHENTAKPQIAQMPYPQFHPVPIHPVFQRTSGITPAQQAAMMRMQNTQMQQSAYQNAMMRNAMSQAYYQQQSVPPYINPAILPAIMQQQQMMMQRQAMTPNRAAVTPPPIRQVAAYPGEVSGNETVVASDKSTVQVSQVPPRSKVLLANQQTSVLQESSSKFTQK